MTAGVTRYSLAFLLALLWGVQPGHAHAQGPPEQEPAEAVAPDVEQARAAYLDGLRLVKAAQWGEALAAFERSNALRPHAMTVYNLGACERALGRYTRAREHFLRALRSNLETSELPPSVVSDAHAFIAEIEQLLVRISVRLEPAGAGVAFDGRPLAPSDPATARSYVAGIRAPGRGTALKEKAFEVIADPGLHVITVSRKGYSDVVLNRTYAPGQQVALRLELERLPATIHVASSEPDALVSVNGKDLGPVPVEVLRPAGLYTIEVAKPGFVRYHADVRVNAGEQAVIRTSLVREQTPLIEKWWFWTAAGVLVSGVAASTFLLTRSEPEPQRPPLDGGTLGWVAPVSR